MVQYDFNLRDYYRILRKRRAFIIFTMLSLGFFSLLFAITSTPTPLYKSTASIKVEKSNSVSGLYVQTFSWSQTDDMQTQVSVIKSYYILEKAAKRLKMIPASLSSDQVRVHPGHQAVIADLKKRVETEQEGNSNIINITVTSEDPKQAQEIADTIALVYKEERGLDINKRTFEAKNFIEDQLKIVKERLSSSEDAVRDYRERNDLISLDAQTGNLLSQISTLKASYEKTFQDHQRILNVKKTLNDAESRPLTSDNSFHVEEANPLYKSLNEKLVQLMLERDTFLITYTEEYPQVVEIKKKIHEIIVSMRAQLTAQEKALFKNLNDLRSRIAGCEEKIRELPEKGLELARLERDVKINTDVYTLLEQKYQEALIKEAEKIDDVQVVRPALESRIPINPPKTLQTAFVGLLMGLILGVVIAFLIETFDTSIGTIEEVENFLGIPVLGIIPHVSAKEIKDSFGEDQAGKSDEEIDSRMTRLVSHFAPKSTLAESYRALRTNLSFSCREKGIKTLVFTSATPREGKTTSIVNLAITTAQAGNKVLLIEADLRKPVIAKLFGVDPSPGLTEILLGNYDYKRAIRTIEDLMTGRLSVDDILSTPGMDNLHIMPSGSIPLNPAELLNSQTINALIAWAKTQYDLVLIDLPPVLAATDAAVLGPNVDGVVIVYRVGKISRNALKRAKIQLDNVKAKIIGVVLNGLKAETSGDYSGFEKDYYYYQTDGSVHRSLPEKATARFALWRDSFLLLLKEKIRLRLKKESADSEKGRKRPQRSKKKSVVKVATLIVALSLLIAGIFYERANLFPAGSRTGKQPAPPQLNRPGTGTIKNSTHVFPVQKKSSDVSEASKLPSDAGLSQNAKQPGSYVIKVKSCPTLIEAKRIAADFAKKGVETYWMSVEKKNKEKWYRVYIGAFDTRAEADNYVKRTNLLQSYPGFDVQKITRPKAQGS